MQGRLGKLGFKSCGGLVVIWLLSKNLFMPVCFGRDSVIISHQKIW